MRVPFNDTSRIFAQNKTSILIRLEEVAASGRWLLSEETRNFASKFSEYCGVSFCIPVANGTDALELAIKSILEDESETVGVITVANAGGYSTTACNLAGVEPIYADVDPDTLLLDIDSMKNCLDSSVQIVIVTHLFGGVVDVPQVRKVLDENGYSHVKIIEDCAQAHGAVLEGTKVGSLGDISAFSFYPTKNLGAMGDAGAVLTNNEVYYNRIKSLHQYGWSSKYNVDLAGGRNSRMDEIQAGILNCLLPSLDAWNKRRKEIYDGYKSSGSKVLKFLDNKFDFVAHLAVVRTKQRDKFTKHMNNNDIMVDIHYPVLDNFQNAWRGQLSKFDQVSELKVSKKAVGEVVSLPCFPTMTDVEVEKVCAALSSWESEGG